MLKRIENKIKKNIYQREENKNYSSPVNSHKNNTLFALNTVNYNHHRKGGKIESQQLYQYQPNKED
jgi:hypothetical protein